MASRFRFHGHAIGAGGRINHPFHEFINIQAASALPEIGGHGFSHSTDFRYRDVLHFRHAYSEVTGTPVVEDANGKKTHRSLTRALVEDVDIMGMVTADRIELRIASYTEDVPGAEPCFKFTGSYFENLRIAGVPVKVELGVDVFDECCTHRQVLDSYRAKGRFHEHYRNAIPREEDLRKVPDRIKPCFPAPPGGDLPHVEGLTTLTLVRKVQLDRPEFSCVGHVIYIEGFGAICLAQVGVSKHERHVTMLRVDLGSPVVGAMDVVTGCGGGVEY